MNWLNWLIIKEKIVIYILYAILFTTIIGYYFQDFRVVVSSYGEILIFAIVTLIGLVQLETDQSQKLKIWFMLNFTSAFSLLLIATKTEFIFKNLAFNSFFKLHFLNISIVVLLAWLCLSLGIFLISSYFRIRNEWLQVLLMIVLLTSFSIWFFTAAISLNLIKIGFDTSIFVIYFALFIISSISSMSFVFLKVNKPINMMSHYSIVQFFAFLYLLIIK